MAALDLSDLGLRATFTGITYDPEGRPVSAGFEVEDAGLAAAIERLRLAAEEMQAAWLALPVGVREGFDGSTITLHTHPDRAAEAAPAAPAIFVIESWEVHESSEVIGVLVDEVEAQALADADRKESEAWFVRTGNRARGSGTSVERWRWTGTTYERDGGWSNP